MYSVALRPVKGLYPTGILLFILCLSLAPIAAQRTISGSVFFADGEEQLGTAVSYNRGFQANNSVTSFGGAYTIEVPDSAGFLYFNWDGTINPALPIGMKKEINVINAALDYSGRVDYPNVQISRSSPTMVEGVISYDGKPLVDSVRIVPMTGENKALPGVSTDARGRFRLEVPAQAGVLKVEYKWLVQHFVIPAVGSVYLPVELDNEFRWTKKMVRKLKKKWKRKMRRQKKRG